ncbi:hypothetical protein TRVA0_011S00936 [Trichomonascus vanleenenianus]|uniref:Dde1p n=1 Tax=Trichomonascus vanleenenianus TaxID=2268995 RepID=UPI003ECAB969
MRKPGETAVYRNMLVGQMGELIQGLGIQDSNGARNGDIADIWKLFQQNNSYLSIAAYSPENSAYGLEQTSANEASSLVQAVGSELAKMCESGSLAIMAPNCLETFICCISAMLFNIPVVIIPLTLEEPHIISAVRKFAPKVVLSTQEIVEELGIGDEVTLVSLKGRAGVTFAHLASSSFTPLDLDVYDATKTKFPISHVYVSGKDKSSVEIAQFTVSNIVAAIAAQIQALPRNDQWSSKDSVFSCSSYTSLFELVLQLSGLVAGATVIFPQLNMPSDLFNLVKHIKPTVIISDDRTSASLASRSERLKLLSLLRLQIANATLSRGQIPSHSAALGSIFSSVRLIHTAVDAGSEEPLTTLQANTIRALTGTRVVHALTAPISASPIAETNMYDYRARDAEAVVNYGALLPCLEAKLTDHGEYDAASRKGRLYVRGTTTTGPSSEWIDTGVIATWGIDGTLRLFI